MIRETTARDLTRMMGESVVLFRYTKADGSQREAYGTLLSPVIDRFGGTSGSSSAARPSGTHAYFDIGRMAWRSFVESRLIGYDDDYDI